MNRMKVCRWILAALLSIVAAQAESLAAALRRPGGGLALQLRRTAPALNPAVLNLALQAQRCASAAGLDPRPDLLTIIDYSRPSTEPRLWVIDLARGRVLFEELVAHGKNSGYNFTMSFSNTPRSRQTSLGLFLTEDTYQGRNGYSLRLRGLEPGVNDKSMERAIVMHGAPYVSAAFVRERGRLGRSWGCPAVREAVARPLIDAIKGGSLIFAYYPEYNWMSSSRYLAECR